MKQIAIADIKEGSVVGGILLDNGDVIMCDNGDYIKAEHIQTEPVNGDGNKATKPFVIEEVFDTWIDLTQEIIGD